MSDEQLPVPLQLRLAALNFATALRTQTVKVAFRGEDDPDLAGLILADADRFHAWLSADAQDGAQRRVFAPTADEFEAWLKRQRDDYERGAGGPQHRDAGYWALDGALDDYRLHGVTGTPLTEPTPSEGNDPDA